MDSDTRVLPTGQEILNQDSGDVFPNQIRGAYPDVDTYLDIHYMLLREDFLRCLRDDFKALREMPFGTKTCGTLRLFYNVQISNIVKVRHEMGIEVLFSTEDYPEEDWDNSKRFMKGSMLLFSKDHFKTAVVGTVLQHNPTKLRDGCVVVRMSEEVSHGSFENCGKKFVMAEPDVYFLPYCQVMKVLQTLTENNFPFRSEIVYGYKGSFELEYIHQYTHYDLPCDVRVPVLQIDQKVTAFDLNLNESQYEALTTALTKRLVLIQGPPGTGKTYVATKIAEILIRNVPVWNGLKRTPILVVCATNRALDQYLEKILPFTEKLVRVGDQSKSNKLKPYTLQAILKACEEEKLHPSDPINTTYKRMAQMWEEVEKWLVEKKNIGSSLVEKYDWEVRMSELEKLYSEAVYNFKEVQQEKTVQKLQEALVVGMTTTCAAQMNSILKKLKPPIVIVEEAAEVFEAHVIACLTKFCKHLILIGDHKQLRATTAHPLSETMLLDVSLFERLVNNGAPCKRLSTQHRMCPDIARLISPVFYDNLDNHTSTFHLPHVKGMQKNMFFMSHSSAERQHKAVHGYSNTFEAEYLLGLAQHFLKQGYKASEIVILAMYSQQVKLMKELQSKRNGPEGVYICTVDNFQGEESPIVLLSLVRNGKGTVGFLRTSNRTCVALSRAQHGLYILGNIELLSSQSEIWKKIKERLDSEEALGDGMPVYCSVHLTKDINAFEVGKTCTCPCSDE